MSRRMAPEAVVPPADPGEYEIQVAAGRNGGVPGWTATVAELEGCRAHGATPEDAVRGVGDAIARWIEDAQAAGREIPPPGAAAAHSGRLLVRMPRSLHGELVRASEREGTSLNSYIVAALASAVGWRRGDRSVANVDPASSRIPALLRANLVVLAVVALAAVALVVAAIVG